MSRAAAKLTLRVSAPAEKITPLLERFAKLGAEVALIETNRDQAIAETNAVADSLAKPLLDELDLIRQALEPWWRNNNHLLLKGARKTVELFGCIIGTKAGRSSLIVPEDAVAKLKRHRWGKDYIRVTEEVDKATTKHALTSRHGEQLKEMGFETTEPTNVFVLERVVQDGTQTKAAS